MLSTVSVRGKPHAIKRNKQLCVKRKLRGIIQQLKIQNNESLYAIITENVMFDLRMAYQRY
jgi:hypothetical protein